MTNFDEYDMTSGLFYRTEPQNKNYKRKKKLKTTRSSADAEGPRDAPQIRNIAHEKVCNRRMTFKDT